MKTKILNKKYLLKFLKQPIIYILVFCVLVQMQIYKTIPEYVLTGDSLTYTEKYTGSIRNGQVDPLRTPVYPYIAKLIKKIGGEENLYKNIVIFQKILFILTLILFYCCVKEITKNKIIQSILTIIFGICPFIIFWNITILTEAFSLFEVVLLSLITIKYLKRPNKILAGAIGLLILIMIMTRPQYIYLLPIYILFWILKFFMDKKEKKQAIIGILSCIICAIMLLIYCTLMKAQHGEFSITGVSYINTTVTAINSNSYKKADNQEMISIVDEYVKESNDGTTTFRALDALKEKYSTEEIKQFASSAIKNDDHFLKYLLSKTLTLGTFNVGVANYFSPIEGYQNINYTIIGNLLLPINFALVYLLMAIEIIYLLWKLIKTKKINWIVAFCTALITANLFTLIVGAPFESQRLFLPSIVPLLILIALILSKKEEKDIIIEEEGGGKNEQDRKK